VKAYYQCWTIMCEYFLVWIVLLQVYSPTPSSFFIPHLHCSILPLQAYFLDVERRRDGCAKNHRH